MIMCARSTGKVFTELKKKYFDAAALAAPAPPPGGATNLQHLCYTSPLPWLAPSSPSDTAVDPYTRDPKSLF